MHESESSCVLMEELGFDGLQIKENRCAAAQIRYASRAWSTGSVPLRALAPLDGEFVDDEIAEGGDAL
ncbi:hypothetical protein PMES_02019 [Profundibacterium mesophilum KAUST100406-0324]|uniref:Uncharacterized protein n=1 Tax=Profundibacterium mesophilum KAUST100406-0324 TaxID=1037889 RepID=A0A921NVR9_9RHOB|nr:hypothetical protein PMES_02019 [Profundibacterium mesophilum KAUST100406-0324]